jgi:hypothetical protein
MDTQAGEKRLTTLLQMPAVSDEDIDRIRSLDIEVVSWVRNNIYIVATEAERALLEERGFSFELVTVSDDELALYKRAMYGESMILSPEYHTYDQIIDLVDNLIKRYPRRISKEIIGNTQQGNRNIYAVKISDDTGSRHDRPVILFTGAIHARELIPVEICVELIKRLVTTVDNDPRFAEWLQRYEIYIIPVINVDGHFIVTNNIDPRWRKNARDATDDWKSVIYPGASTLIGITTLTLLWVDHTNRKVCDIADHIPSRSPKRAQSGIWSSESVPFSRLITIVRAR